jgi:type II secretory pathway component PulC
MLRGLVARQVFFVLDLVLMIVVGLVAVLAIKGFLATPVSPDNTDLAVSGPAPFDIVTLLDRNSYSAISTNNLFGPTVVDGADVAPPPEVVDPGIVEDATELLPLTLLGTTSRGPSDPLATAVIHNARERDQLKQRTTYYIDEIVLDQISVKVVGKREVELYNAATRKRLLLKMDKDTKRGPAPSSRRPVRRTSGLRQMSGVISVNRKQLNEDLMAAADQIRTMNPRVHYDANNKAVGVTADGLSDMALASKLGFQDGDVVQKINGQVVDSIPKVAEVLQKFQSLPTLRINVLRGGKSQMITFKVD